MNCTATRLSMIVLRISLTLKYALNAPGMAPQMPPPTAPARSTKGTRTTAGRPGTASAVAVAARPPMAI